MKRRDRLPPFAPFVAAITLAAVAQGSWAGAGVAMESGDSLEARSAPEAGESRAAKGFLEEFKAAMKAKDGARMTSLVQANQAAAVELIIDTCEKISEGPTEELELLIEALGDAWSGAFETKFVTLQYEYFSLMRPEIRRNRAELKQKYEAELEKFNEALETKVYRDLPAVGYELEGYAKGFAEMGDGYFASEAWLTHAWAFEEKYLGDNANLDAAYKGFEKGIQARERIGLIDERLNEAKDRLQLLSEAGVGDPNVEFKGSLAGKARREAEAAAAFTIPMKFEVIKKIGEFARPYYAGDEVYQMWPILGLGEQGSSAEFPTMEDSPKVLRSGASEAKVMLGEEELSIPLTGAMVPVEVTLGSGDEARPWAFLAKIGQERDRYQGFDFNLSVDSFQMQIFLAPAASLVGEANGIPLRVVDDNMDGIYGSEPKFWAYTGTLEGSSGQADFDTLLVDKEKTGRPWSPITKLADQWYRMSIGGASGTDLTMAPTEVKTGTIKLDFKGAKPDYVIVQCQGDHGASYFDLVPGGKKGTEVPTGTFDLITGRISKGKGEQVMKAMLVPPLKRKSWELREGETLTIELGAPFGFDFEVKQDDERATVIGTSVVVTGRGGESYQRLWNCVVTPDASARAVGAKKGGKAEEMKKAGHQDDISAAGDYTVAWFPFDVELEKKKAGEEVEVQLVEKKHKLFGKIESEWRK